MSGGFCPCCGAEYINEEYDHDKSCIWFGEAKEKITTPGASSGGIYDINQHCIVTITEVTNDVALMRKLRTANPHMTITEAMKIIREGLPHRIAFNLHINEARLLRHEYEASGAIITITHGLT